MHKGSLKLNREIIKPNNVEQRNSNIHTIFSGFLTTKTDLPSKTNISRVRRMKKNANSTLLYLFGHCFWRINVFFFLFSIEFLVRTAY